MLPASSVRLSGRSTKVGEAHISAAIAHCTVTVHPGRDFNLSPSLVKMKLLAITSLLTLASGVAIPDPSIVDYDGWKVLRVKTGHAIDEVYNKLSHLDYDEWANEGRRHIDIALSPDQLEVFETLDLDYHCMHENLGRSIAAETANMPSIWKRQADDLAWWDTYHPYADHRQWFEDIQAEYPDNSEIFSSGTSYEDRDLYGLHFWGADGPGKPAILWHATVHAREWITAMVRDYFAIGNGN